MGSGGSGVSVREIMSYLESITPGPSKHSLGSIAAMAEELEEDNRGAYLPVPLLDGQSLGIAFLEWVISEQAGTGDGVPQAVKQNTT